MSSEDRSMEGKTTYPENVMFREANGFKQTPHVSEENIALDVGAKDVRNDKNEVEDEKPVAPNGGWGWMVVIGASLLQLLLPTILMSYGILYVELVETYGVSSTAAAWIPALNTAVSSFTAPVFSVLTCWYPHRLLTLTGVFIAATGVTLSSLSTSMEFLCVSYGLMGGLGTAMCIPVANLLVQKYFTTRRGTACGIFTAGGSLGQIIMPLFLQYLYLHYGYRGALLLHGGIVFHGLLGASLLQPVERYMKKRNSGTINMEKDTFDKISVEKEISENISRTEIGKHKQMIQNCEKMKKETNDILCVSNGDILKKNDSNGHVQSDDSFYIDFQYKNKEITGLHNERYLCRDITNEHHLNRDLHIENDVNSKDLYMKRDFYNDLSGRKNLYNDLFDEKHLYSNIQDDLCLQNDTISENSSHSDSDSETDLYLDLNNVNGRNWKNPLVDNLISVEEDRMSFRRSCSVDILPKIPEEGDEDLGDDEKVCEKEISVESRVLLEEYEETLGESNTSVMFLTSAESSPGNFADSTDISACVPHVLSDKDILQSHKIKEPSKSLPSFRNHCFPMTTLRDKLNAVYFTFLNNPLIYIPAFANGFGKLLYQSFVIIIPSFGISLGFSKTDAAFPVAVIAIADTCSRLFIPWFSDFLFVPRRILYIGGAIITGLASLVMSFTYSYSMVLACCIMFGLGIGAMAGLAMVLLTELTGIDNLPGSYGLVQVICGIITFTGNLAVGMVRDWLGSFRACFQLLVMVSVIPALVWTVEPLIRRHVRKTVANDTNKEVQA